MLPPGEEQDKQIILQLYMMHENKEMKESNNDIIPGLIRVSRGTGHYLAITFCFYLLAS